MSGAGTGISGGGTGLMSGGGLSMGSGGRGKSGFEGCSIMDSLGATTLPVVDRCFGRMARVGVSSYTSNPIARMSASALLCSTTPGRMR
jgi:uncharacterized membrane protein